MFTVRRILLIGLLAASATGCAVVPYESHVVHEVYDPYPYAYPSAQVYIYQSRSYGDAHRGYGNADRDRSHVRKSIERDDRSNRPHERARDAKPAKRDVARAEPRREPREHSARQERAEPRRDVDRPRQARNDSRDVDRPRQARNDSRDNDRRERR